jgi:hypothetical protein
MGNAETVKYPSDRLAATEYEPKQGLPKNLVDKHKPQVPAANLRIDKPFALRSRPEDLYRKTHPQKKVWPPAVIGIFAHFDLSANFWNLLALAYQNVCLPQLCHNLWPTKLPFHERIPFKIYTSTFGYPLIKTGPVFGEQASYSNLSILTDNNFKNTRKKLVAFLFSRFFWKNVTYFSPKYRRSWRENS